MIDLTGKTVLITGGSRGVGRAAARLFGRAGANIVISYLENHEAAESVREELRTAGRQVVVRAGDLSHEEEVEALFAAGREAFEGIDIVVANAGIWKRQPIESMSLAQWAETLQVNLTSVFLTCRAAAPEMKRRGSGSLVLVSSTAGQRGEAFYSHYAASKGALISFAKSLAAELGPFGIRVNVVAPGWVVTEMSAEVLSDPEHKRKIEQEIPLRRIAVPEDVAGPILFLASDLARHIQGEVLNVNGGSVLCG